MAKKKMYELLEPEYVKKIKDASDVTEHNDAFIKFVNEKAAKKYIFRGLVYNKEYAHGAKLVFEKDSEKHEYKIVNMFLENEKDFRFCIDLGALYGRVYLYEIPIKEEKENAGSKQ